MLLVHKLFFSGASCRAGRWVSRCTCVKPHQGVFFPGKSYTGHSSVWDRAPNNTAFGTDLPPVGGSFQFIICLACPATFSYLLLIKVAFAFGIVAFYRRNPNSNVENSHWFYRQRILLQFPMSMNALYYRLFYFRCMSYYLFIIYYLLFRCILITYFLPIFLRLFKSHCIILLFLCSLQFFSSTRLQSISLCKKPLAYSWYSYWKCIFSRSLGQHWSQKTTGQLEKHNFRMAMSAFELVQWTIC